MKKDNQNPPFIAYLLGSVLIGSIYLIMAILESIINFLTNT